MTMTNDDNKEIAPIGFYNFRNHKKKFGIKTDDRRRHVYVIGKTGVGKTTLLENMVIADIRAGRGVGVVDPHGEFAEKMLDFVPEERLDDVIYFNPADMEHPIAFNPMEQIGTEFRHLIASGIMGVFKKIWPDVWSARMEYILNNTLLALLESPGSTLLGIMRMLSEPIYRKKVVESVQDPVIKAFWVNEFARYTQRLEVEAVAAIQNKVGQFVSNPLIRNILGQPHSTMDIRGFLDNGKIFIANLSKGKIGEDNSALLGAMIITRLQLAAMSRVDVPEEKRKDFYLYVDEFQNFATESFAGILSEARKYRLSLILAHQYIGQLVHEQNTKVRDAVFGNVGTLLCFRVGATDAEFLEKEFMPEFVQGDLVNLAKANIYAKLMIDGVACRPFSAETLPPQKPPLVSNRDVIIQNSRDKYSTPKKTVEATIAAEWKTEGAEVIREKVERRGERSVGQVLKGEHFVQRKPPSRDYFSSRREPERGDRFERRDFEQRNRPEQKDRLDRSRPQEYQRPKPQPPRPPSSFEEKPRVTSPQSSFEEKTERPNPPHPPQHFPKKDVNIEDLRQAISKSLNKDAQKEESQNAEEQSDKV